MPKEIVAALIAVGGVIFTQLITYTISRQNARDLRVNIDREIGIIKKLRSDSPEARQLESHVKASIAKLIARDERREQLADILSTVGPMMLTTWGLWGLTFWYQNGAPPAARPYMSIAFWFLVAALIIQLATWARLSIKIAFAVVDIWVTTTWANWGMRRRLRDTERKIALGESTHQGLLAEIKWLEGQKRDAKQQEVLDNAIRIAAESPDLYSEARAELAIIKARIKSRKPVRQFLRRLREPTTPAQQADLT